MGRRKYDFWPHYEPSRPLQTKNGIKSKSQKGSFGKSWWAKQFVSVLETFGWSNRLARGRRYARQGQVLHIEIKNGTIKAEVQGSTRNPYKITIIIPIYDLKTWTTITEGLAFEALISAELLTGEMPKEIIQIMKKIGYNLLPESSKDLHTNCSCPDSANPCKHIAAVYYIVGEKFDEDPFLMFILRGIEKDTLLELLRKHRMPNQDLNKELSSIQAEKDIQGKNKVEWNIQPKDFENFWGEKRNQIKYNPTVPQDGNIFDQVILNTDNKEDKEVIKFLEMIKNQLKPIYEE